MTLSSAQLEQEMGRRVDALLKLAGASRRELAMHLGKSPAAIGHKLSNTRGRTLDAWEILAVAEWFGVTVGVLYGTEPMPERLGKPGAALLTPEPRNSTSDQQRRAGDQFPIHSDVRHATDTTCEADTRYPVAV